MCVAYMAIGYPPDDSNVNKDIVEAIQAVAALTSGVNVSEMHNPTQTANSDALYMLVLPETEG